MGDVTAYYRQQHQERLMAQNRITANPVIMILGTLLFLAGIGLVVGNRTGLFPTIPFAGCILTVIGGLVSAAGKRLG